MTPGYLSDQLYLQSLQFCNSDWEPTTIDLQLKLVDCILDCTNFRYLSSTMSHTTPGLLVILLLIQGISICSVTSQASAVTKLYLPSWIRSRSRDSIFKIIFYYRLWSNVICSRGVHHCYLYPSIHLSPLCPLLSCSQSPVTHLWGWWQ